MLDILLIDDEPSILAPYAEALSAEGHRVTTAEDGLSALALVSSRTFDVIITDVRLPKANGMQIFERARQLAPRTRVILMTAYPTVDDAVVAMRGGAVDYLRKPFVYADLRERLARIDSEHALSRQLAAAQPPPGEPGLVGFSPPMARLHDLIGRFARSDDTVLITGESGTGKELVARELHRRSARRAGPFVAVNCAAFPEGLLEAELFGHEKGAFTGALKRREGRFEAARGGTLLLDEVAEMSPAAQAKLLRVLQEGTYQPLGTNETVRADARIVAATHRNLKHRIAQHTFREDLYFRLKVLELPVPPLRERRGDLMLLVNHFLQRYAAGNRMEITGRALAALSQHPFPGNVRELEHALRYALALAGGGPVDLDHLPPEIAGAGVGKGAGDPRSLSEAMREFEREYLKRALQRTQGRRARAAELLGISRKNLWEKLRAYGLGREIDEPPEPAAPRPPSPPESLTPHPPMPPVAHTPPDGHD